MSQSTLEITPPKSTGALVVKRFRKIEEINPETWNQLFPDTLENYYFYKTLDESHFDQFSFYYFLVYANETVVGAAPCFIMNYALETTVQGPLKVIFSALKKIIPNFLSFRVLVCGLPMEQGRIGFGNWDSSEVFRAILNGMEQLAKEKQISILGFKDFQKHFCVWLDELEHQGFYKFQSLPTTQMEIRFEGFEQYFKTLSRVSRDGLKRKFKKVDGIVSIDMEVTNELTEEVLGEVYALYRQTESQGDYQFETAPKDFFRVISKNLPDVSKYFLWRIQGKLVAFALGLVSKELFVDFYLGFDYSVAYQYHLYFVRFRDLIKWCIEHKIENYEMGNTNYEPKRRFGFDFIPLFAYAKHRNKYVNPFFQLLCKALKPENFDLVFREMKRQRSK